MTEEDAEIVRRLAEIEGCLQRTSIDGKQYEFVSMEFNPLRFTSQAFELVEKYGCHISTDEEGIWDVNVPRRWGSYPGATDASLQRAICLAVIEAQA